MEEREMWGGGCQWENYILELHYADTPLLDLNTTYIIRLQLNGRWLSQFPPAFGALQVKL